MPDSAELKRVLDRIDGRSYPAYRDLQGAWLLGETEIVVDQIQGDPFAAPSRMRVRVATGITQDLNASERQAAEDWLLRRFVQTLTGSRRGSGKSGMLTVYQPGPEVVERSALRLLRDGTAEIRFRAGLPARGRRVLAQQAWLLLSQDIIRAAAVVHSSDGLTEHIASVVTQQALRAALQPQGLIAFVANGSVLPRKSGISQSPLSDAVPFVSPPTLECTLQTPSGPITGMGIPTGVTVIVGGGFHGKSTLLAALQRGHLDHIPADGRHRVVAVPNGVKIRAEDGRRVAKVDISPFLNNLPGGRSTTPFCTDDASGSTSQAAAICEAVECGCTVLWMDEDTSATNLLVRDERMRALVPRDREPITPLVERVRQMHEQWGVSTVLVVGGVADYLAAADTVIALNAYNPQDATQRAKELFPVFPAPQTPLKMVPDRVPLRHGLAAHKIRAQNARRLRYGDGEIELSAIEQILDAAHATTIGQAIRLMHDELMDQKRTLRQLIAALEGILDDEGIDALSPRNYPDGDLIRPRMHEVAAALNRVRTLQIAPAAPNGNHPT